MIKIFEKFNEPEKLEEFWGSGHKKYEEWYLKGKRHREDGPAHQRWFENGQKWYEIWYLNGKRHREDGRAYQQWYSNGQIEYERWFLNNKRYSREEWVEELKRIGSSHYEEQRMLLDMEKYNL